jgi:hypothetical protein
MAAPRLRIAVPDLISNSYFPAIAAVELGKFKEQGFDASIELIFPVNGAYAALREGTVDCIAGSAHSALSAFPEWERHQAGLRPGPGHVGSWSCGRISAARAAT